MKLNLHSVLIWVEDPKLAFLITDVKHTLVISFAISPDNRLKLGSPKVHCKDVCCLKGHSIDRVDILFIHRKEILILALDVMHKVYEFRLTLKFDHLFIFHNEFIASFIHLIKSADDSVLSQEEDTF